MSFDDLDDLGNLVGAIRAADGDDDDGELADATRLRVRRSLEIRARSRHRAVGLLTAAGILFGGTVSWALVKGEIGSLWRPAPEVAPVAPAPAPPPLSGPRTVRRAPPVAVPAPQIVVAVPTPLPPETVPPPSPGPDRPRPRRPVATAVPVEARYRRAHDLHFHGGDPAVTLAAWDAYLAAEPSGRFSVDARYNRALLLIRLRRYAAARDALAPFARGEVEPAGYRQPEAEQLLERLARAR
jgi:hypothetical protein